MARNDPYAQFNFILEIEGTTVAGFTEVGGLSMDQDIIEYREGADTATARKLPGLRKYGNISLKRGPRTATIAQAQCLDDRSMVFVYVQCFGGAVARYQSHQNM